MRRSTLSGWFKNVILTPKQKKKLFRDWQNALVKAREKAVVWHRQQKIRRLQEARKQAVNVVEHIDIQNPYIVELALAILYLGEGTKATDETSMGSTDPMILQFFLACLKRLYNLNIEKVRCELHLRAAQNLE